MPAPPDNRGVLGVRGTRLSEGPEPDEGRSNAANDSRIRFSQDSSVPAILVRMSKPSCGAAPASLVPSSCLTIMLIVYQICLENVRDLSDPVVIDKR
jgi:hypothetical protein